MNTCKLKALKDRRCFVFFLTYLVLGLAPSTLFARLLHHGSVCLLIPARHKGASSSALSSFGKAVSQDAASQLASPLLCEEPLSEHAVLKALA